MTEAEIVEWVRRIVEQGATARRAGFRATAPMDSEKYRSSLKAYLFRLGFEITEAEKRRQ